MDSFEFDKLFYAVLDYRFTASPRPIFDSEEMSQQLIASLFNGVYRFFSSGTFCSRESALLTYILNLIHFWHLQIKSGQLVQHKW